MARTTVDIQLRWGDQDAYGHVNNVAFARFLEEARARTFWLAAGREATGLDEHFSEREENADKMLVASQHIEFLRVLEYSADPIALEMWIGRIGGSSLEIHYEIFTGESSGRELVARAITTVVMVDGTTLKITRLNETARAALAPWSDEPLQLRRA